MKNRERLGPEGLQGRDAIVSVDRLSFLLVTILGLAPVTAALAHGGGAGGDHGG